jgi:hypothetical protein
MVALSNAERQRRFRERRNALASRAAWATSILAAATTRGARLRSWSPGQGMARAQRVAATMRRAPSRRNGAA